MLPSHMLKPSYMLTQIPLLSVSVVGLALSRTEWHPSARVMMTNWVRVMTSSSASSST